MIVRITVRHWRPQLPRATPLLPSVRSAIRGPAAKPQRLPRLRHLLADVEPRRQPRDPDVAEDTGRGEEHLVEQQAGAASEKGPHAPVNNGIAGFLRRIQPRGGDSVAAHSVPVQVMQTPSSYGWFGGRKYAGGPPPKRPTHRTKLGPTPCSHDDGGTCLEECD